jgi:hypothetical protein
MLGPSTPIPQYLVANGIPVKYFFCHPTILDHLFLVRESKVGKSGEEGSRLTRSADLQVSMVHAGLKAGATREARACRPKGRRHERSQGLPA